MNRIEAGKMIRLARMRSGMTQDELARKLNVKQGTVGAWEIGYSFPRPKSMVKLCEILNIPVEELLKAG
jgi:transcriptional regulator with XRE-family HTH domain